MALNLEQKCKDRLMQVVAQILERAQVHNGNFLEYESLDGLENLDTILPEIGLLRKNLEGYVDDTPFSTFFDETISKDLYENYEYNSESKRTPLGSLPKYNDLQTVAKHLVEEFDSLPFQYLVSFEFPSSIGGQLRKEIETAFQFDTTLRIVSPDAQYDRKYPLRSGIKQRNQHLFDSYWVFDNIGKREPKEWNQGTVYLQINVEGFVGKYLATSPILKVIEVLKSFIGLSIALTFIKVKRTHLVRPQVKHLIIHRRIGEKWEIWNTYKLPMNLTEILDNLNIDDTGAKQGNKEDTQWTKLWLPVLSFCFKNPKKCKRLLKASQWLLDSYTGNNELLSFVQVMIAMEVLLGGKKSDKIGLVDLLVNRCAYLVGKNNDERKQLLKELYEIYDVRSDIVHRGKNKLGTRERRMFFKLRNLCSRVILKELMLICKDAKSSPISDRKKDEVNIES